jgi:hypothetical protein
MHGFAGESRMTKMVRYVCRRSDHQQLSLFDARATWSPNTLTPRGGAWAYCPVGQAEGHEWEQIADRAIDGLREEIETAIARAKPVG